MSGQPLPEHDLNHEDERFAHNALMRAQETIRQFLPEALPRNPIYLKVVDFGLGEAPSHLGTVEGYHFIVTCGQESATINAENLMKLYPSFLRPNHKPIVAEAFAERTLIEELLHARHEEIAGEDRFTNVSLSGIITLNEVKQLPYRRIHELINERLEEKGVKFQPIDNIASIVIEGVANYGVIYLMHRRAEQLRNEGRSDEATIFETMSRDTLNGITHRTPHPPDWIDYWEEGKFRNRLTYYGLGVLKIIKPLADKFSQEEILEIIKAIDLVKCRSIKWNSKKAKHILADPTLLPGLENLPAIRDYRAKKEVVS